MLLSTISLTTNEGRMSNTLLAFGAICFIAGCLFVLVALYFIDQKDNHDF